MPEPIHATIQPSPRQAHLLYDIAQYEEAAYFGHVLLGLFRLFQFRNRRYLCSFVSYTYSGMNGMLFRSCYSVHSVPDSRMNGIVFWRENCASPPVSFDHVSYSVFGMARDLFFWKLIFCVFCYSYSEIGINGIVPKERALHFMFILCLCFT